jgi:hypothetical protein
MGARFLRMDKKKIIYPAGMDTLIERLKKMRALNCNPSDVGVDRYILKKMLFNKLNVLTKFL